MRELLRLEEGNTARFSTYVRVDGRERCRLDYVVGHRQRTPFPSQSPFSRLEELDRELATILSQTIVAKKKQLRGSAAPELDALLASLSAVQAQFSAELERVRIKLGYSPELLERLFAGRAPKDDGRLYYKEIRQAPTTSWLDDNIEAVLAAMKPLVAEDWLLDQAKRNYRINPREPLELVGGHRIERRGPLPQRFAHMLLLASDHVNERPDLDMFAAAQLVPELLALGTRLRFVTALGPEADAKLRALPAMADKDVASSVHELLVGTALVRHGQKTTMVRPTNEKTADLRVHDIAHLPLVVECKRRVGLLEYERREGDEVRRLFDHLARSARERQWTGYISADFFCELSDIPASEWLSAVASTAPVQTSIAKPWGRIVVTPRPAEVSVPQTRLFSPDYLSHVFKYSAESGEWDGLICTVDAQSSVALTAVQPLGLRWRSSSSAARLKKSRGISSLFADASKQIGDLEVGVIYIAYPEGTRAAHADSRTDDTLARVQAQSWYYRGGRQIPIVIIARLHASPQGVGTPDLIENSQILHSDSWDPVILTHFPALVFTDGRRGPREEKRNS